MDAAGITVQLVRLKLVEPRDHTFDGVENRQNQRLIEIDGMRSAPGTALWFASAIT